MKNIPKIKSHVFYNKKFKIKFGAIKKNATKAELTATSNKCNVPVDSIMAMTDHRATKNKTILISDTIDDDKDLLRVIIDESLHALDERIDNDVVAVYATDLARFLWRCGYRRLSPEDIKAS